MILEFTYIEYEFKKEEEYGRTKIITNSTIRFTLKGAHCILAKAHTDIQVLNKALLVPEG